MAYRIYCWHWYCDYQLYIRKLSLYQLVYYVPETHLELTKAKLFEIGVGAVGNYRCCAWQIKGQGQFAAMDSANPYIGKPSETTTVDEYKVELVVSDELISRAIDVLKQCHPYEPPAFSAWRLEFCS